VQHNVDSHSLLSIPGVTEGNQEPLNGRSLVPITVIPGDGIGPEIVEAVLAILSAAEAPLSWTTAQAGLGCLDEAPNGLPEATLAAIQRDRVALKGPTETPSGAGHKSVNVTIRKTLDLYANVRPVKSLSGVPTRFSGVDLVIVRENIEDTYGGIEHMQTPDVAQCLKIITRPGSLAIARHAFALARNEGRRRVTCVHKANIHKLTDGLFLQCFREVAAQHPDIASDDMLVDNACMQLVTAPERFDVMVMPNLYGDILSDLAAGLVGGLGVAPSGNIGHGLAVFEAVHGTAPDLVGARLANPTALLLSALQMLRHLGFDGCAARIETGLHRALAQGIKTRDLGGTASTDQFVEAVIAGLPAVDDDPDGAFATSRVVARGASTLHPVYEVAGALASQNIPAGRAAEESDAPRGSDDAKWETCGMDVFVEHDGVPDLPAEIGPLRLAMISNRGTKVFPGPSPAIAMVNWHRARYVADAAVTNAELLQVLSTIGEGHGWMHVELLRRRDGVAFYSKAQGE
jgi:NAD-dependent isocitrate dehydrogenase